MDGQIPLEPDQSTRSLTAVGVTILGVLVSIGATVGFSLAGPAWLRVAAGAVSTIVLIAIVKLSTRHGRGPLARVAKWIVSAPPSE